MRIKPITLPKWFHELKRRPNRMHLFQLIGPIQLISEIWVPIRLSL